ncbi:unnamed protein product [Strongylus vulgaris]|uniref:Uncharacterized protein n=1 Tax=Strongylus vulgaris TaxID=40348 RepID=A0A3P7JA18_STRVU|nr:unnamed protein product [Strongylus vulgaris]
MVLFIKGTGWARDPRMTNSKWSPDHENIPFIIICSLKPSPTENWYSWYNPIVGHFELQLCRPRNATWNMDKNLIESHSAIKVRLHEYEQEVEEMKAKFLKHLKRLSDYWCHEAKHERTYFVPGSLNKSWYAFAI